MMVNRKDLAPIAGLAAPTVIEHATIEDQAEDLESFDLGALDDPDWNDYRQGR